MRMLKFLIALVMLPAVVAAQDQAVLGPDHGLQTAFAQLDDRLDKELASQIKGLVNDAVSRGLPGLAIADVALHGVAMERSGEEVRAAAEAFARDLASARDAFQQAGRVPDASEIEAGATAMSLGVEGTTISYVAKTAPRDQPLSVAVLVIGALASQGLSAVDVAETVLEGLKENVGDAELARLSGEAGRMLAEGLRPAEVGRALAAGITNMTIPAGAPFNVPRNNGQPGERPVQPPVPPVPVP